MLSRFAVLAVLATVALGDAGSASGVTSYVIQGDYKIGGYAVKADGSLAGALAEFGPSTSRRRKYNLGEGCDVRWRSLGLRIEFLNLAGRNPCSPRWGRFNGALITGRRWRTSLGLAIGDPLARLRRLHPKAQFHRDRFYGASWWLVTRPTRIGLTNEYPGLLARVRNGRVSEFVVDYKAGGD